MNVLFIIGSPRKNGNTDILAKSVMDGVKENGGATEVVYLSEHKISPCVACGGCETTGKCVIQDDMQELYDKVDSADRVVIASPIYFYGVTAQTKAFIDRCQAFWSRKYLLKKRMEGDVARKGIFLSVSATKGERIFEGAVLSAKYAFDAIDVDYGGEILVRGVDSKGAILKMDDMLEQARSFGKKIVSD